ncbi:MAG: phosphatidylserine decarboxylase [Phycisphaerales bacterium]|nr:phosphatidylserine decarboxylase [Phycisphaerales bacterium]
MLRISKHGRREILIGTLVLLLAGLALSRLFWPLGLAVLPLWVWLIAFFRDPERPIPTAPEALVSPADGTVTDIQTIEHDEHLGGPALRIGIFLSVFNVHVNRAPCDGVVSLLQYRKGRFVNALDHATASAENESNTIVLADRPGGRAIASVKQIAGLIARRIVCDLRLAQDVSRGQRIGLIKFGSRTELSVPMWRNPVASVRVGQKVRGASDVICTVVPMDRPVPGVPRQPQAAR